MRPKYPHSQFELFPGVVGHTEQKTDTRIFFKSITISIENFVVLAVVIIISMVTAFSIGVERGKRSVPLRSAQRTEAQPVEVKTEPPPALSEHASQPALDTTPPQAVEIATPILQAAAEPEPSTLAAKTVVEKNPEKQYTVQVASFKKEHYAQKEAEGLKESGYEIFVMPKGSYSIVCVGKFARKAQAKEISKRLRKKYKDCLIRSL